MTNPSDLQPAFRENDPTIHEEETTGEVAHATGVQLGMLVLLVLVNLLVLWVLWSILTAT